MACCSGIQGFKPNSILVKDLVVNGFKYQNSKHDDCSFYEGIFQGIGSGKYHTVYWAHKSSWALTLQIRYPYSSIFL